MNYYTYAYLRANRTPYYIGKGQGDRAYRKRQEGINPPKNKTKILILKENLTEEEAFKHEIYMIAVFGRKDLGTGILRNKTEGGEGISGYKHTKKTKRKLSERKMGDRNPFYGRSHTEESKKKIRERHLGIPKHNEKSKLKISKSKIGKNNSISKWWKITFNNGDQIVVCGLTIWSKENGYDESAINKVEKGLLKKHKNIVEVEKWNK
ncbi:translation initiation factor 2 [Synechococcus phage B3]|nr:translation initiation factor 2 [Synechococcus phage B3]QGT54673.1 translation initiation factor 2 [Synechococcus phage B23]